MTFFRALFYSPYIRVGIYVVVGIGINTAAPHYPTFSGNFGWQQELHSLVQYIISVGLWPASLWHPTFTIGEWTGL